MASRAKFPPGIHSAEIDLFLLDIAEGRLGEAEASLPGLWVAARETANTIAKTAIGNWRRNAIAVVAIRKSRRLVSNPGSYLATYSA